MEVVKKGGGIMSSKIWTVVRLCVIVVSIYIVYYAFDNAINQSFVLTKWFGIFGSCVVTIFLFRFNVWFWDL